MESVQEWPAQMYEPLELAHDDQAEQGVGWQALVDPQCQMVSP